MKRKKQKSLRSFTLIELMVAVCILAIGMTLVSGSFLTVISAISSTSTRIKAIQFLEGKMAELEQEVKEKGGVEEKLDEEDILVGERPAVLVLEITALEVETDIIIEEEEEYSQEGFYQEEKKEYVADVRLTLLWKEKNIQRSSTLETYLPLLIPLETGFD